MAGKAQNLRIAITKRIVKSRNANKAKNDDKDYKEAYHRTSGHRGRHGKNENDIEIKRCRDEKLFFFNSV